MESEEFRIGEINPTNLIIAPHPDDEVLWCFSQLDAGSRVVILGRDENKIELLNLSLELSKQKRYSVFEYYYNHGHYLESYRDIIKILEDFVFDRYQRIFYPSRCSHQDHNTINEVMRSVLRPSKDLPKFVHSAYEYSYWRSGFDFNTFIPLLTREKSLYLSKYPTQSAKWIEYVKFHDRLTGLNAGLHSPAEAFKMVLRYGI